MSLPAFLPIFMLLLLGEAIFSGSEIAIISANRARLRTMANEGNGGAEIALRLLDSPEWLMGTILTCHNICFVTNVSLATLVAIDQVGSKYGDLVSVLVVIPFLVIFGEVVPKSYCQDRADTLAPRLAKFIWVVRLLVYPVNWLLSHLIRMVLGSGKNGEAHSPFVTRQELEVLVGEPSEGDVRAGERRMIGRIFSFSERDVSNVMVPLVEVSAVNEEATVEEVIERIEADGHSKILVYRKEIHHIVGVVRARDIIARGEKARGSLKEIPDLLHPPYFVPESKPAGDLLEELQQTNLKLAVVVDEYGGCVGVATMEDLIEEIVGEISDEYDVEEVRFFEKLGNGKYMVDARMEVEAVREDLSIPIPPGDYETLGGYLLEVFERIPKPGEKVEVDRWAFTVTQATDRQIEYVRCEHLPEEIPSQTEETK